MAHEDVWYSHPRKYGKGSRQWYVSTLHFFAVDAVQGVFLEDEWCYKRVETESSFGDVYTIARLATPG